MKYLFSDSLQELNIIETEIVIDSWSNLKYFHLLNSQQSDTSSELYLQSFLKTFPSSQLQSFLVRDHRRNIVLIHDIIQAHDQSLQVLNITGNICTHSPMRTMFDDVFLHLNKLEIFGMYGLWPDDILFFIQKYGSSLRVLDCGIPLFIDFNADIYDDWFLKKCNEKQIFPYLQKLEVLIIRGYDNQKLKYSSFTEENVGWKELVEKIQSRFRKYHRNEKKYNGEICNEDMAEEYDPPLILFDMPSLNGGKFFDMWFKNNLKSFLLQNSLRFELNYSSFA